MNPASNNVTSEAVLREVIGERVDPAGAERLSDSQLEEVRDALEHFFLRWSPPPLDANELRVSLGAGGRVDTSLLGNLVLYAHSVVIRDPLERWLAERGPGERAPGGYELAGALAEFQQLQDLIEPGIVIPAPFPTRLRWVRFSDSLEYEPALARAASSKPLFARAVLGELPVGEEIWPLLIYGEDPDDLGRDLSLIPNLPNPDRDGLLSFALSSVLDEAEDMVLRLRHATSAGASFTPLSRRDMAFVEAALPGFFHPEDVSQRIDAQVVSTLTEVRVPAFGHLTPKEMSAARRNAAGFEEWRLYLKQLLEETGNRSGGDTEKMEYLVNEGLVRVATQVRREASMSRALKHAARDSACIAGVSAVLWGGAAAAGASDLGIVGTGVGALGRILATPLMRQRPAGYRGVMLRLLGKE